MYLNHSLNKHYMGGTRVTIRRQPPTALSSPAGLLAAAQTGGGDPPAGFGYRPFYKQHVERSTRHLRYHMLNKVHALDT